MKITGKSKKELKRFLARTEKDGKGESVKAGYLKRRIRGKKEKNYPPKPEKADQ